MARAADVIGLSDAEPWRKAAAEILKSLPPHLFERMSSAKKVLVVPDDMLWRVPFEALPVKSGYLADATRVTYAASLTALVKPPRVAASEPLPFKVALVAAPAIPALVVETLKTTAPTWTLRASDAALAEAAKIQELIGAEGAALVTGDEATEEAVRAAAAAATVLHVEGPFRVNAASPLFSPVLLKGTEGATTPANNGVIEGREIPSAGFSTRVAVFADPASLSMRDAAAALTPFHWVWRAGGTDAVLGTTMGG